MSNILFTPEEHKDIINQIMVAMDDNLLEYRVNHPSAESLSDKEVLKLWTEEMCEKGFLKKVGENEYNCVYPDDPTIQ